MDLHLKSLSKHYADVSALNGVNLDIASGELVALLGPSGSGKTTLLRVIAGLLHPDEGRVLFGDNDATQLSLRERNVGFVFQHYALFRHMTVAENIAFGLRSRSRRKRPDKATIKRRVDDLLRLIQLNDHGLRYPDQLSGGQKQRVALARALAIEPSVLLLDEPFGALDAKVRVEMRRWLRRLHQQMGQTTVFVTHDQEEALELADRVVVMRDGRIEQVGTPDEIYNAPASAYVYDFIGRANAISGRVDSDHFVVETTPVRWPARACETGSARMYVRPHDLVLGDEKDGIPASVLATHRLADRYTVEVDVQGQPNPIEIDIMATHGATIPSRGARVGLHPARYQIYNVV